MSSCLRGVGISCRDYGSSVASLSKIWSSVRPATRDHGRLRGARVLRRAGPGLPAEALDIPGHTLDVAERVRRNVAQRPQHRVVERREPIMDPQAVAPRFDEARSAQIREVARDGGLREAQRLVQTAHADLAVDEQRQDPQARRVGQRSKQPLNPSE